MTNGPRHRLDRVSRRFGPGMPANPLERRVSKFLREPPSIRIAASVIVTATALIVVGGGILIRLLDTALTILDRRFAEGAISFDDYQQRRDVLTCALVPTESGRS